MSMCPDGFQPVIDRRGKKRLPESWHDQLVLFVLPGDTAPQALRFSELPRCTNLQKVFFRASEAALEEAWADDATKAASVAVTVTADTQPAEPVAIDSAPAPRPARKPTESRPIFFRQQWRVEADALPPSRLFAHMRSRRDALVEKLGGKPGADAVAAGSA